MFSKNEEIRVNLSTLYLTIFTDLYCHYYFFSTTYLFFKDSLTTFPYNIVLGNSFTNIIPVSKNFALLVNIIYYQAYTIYSIKNFVPYSEFKLP